MSKGLLISGTVVWGLIAFLSVMPAMMSFMMFDAPGSASSWLTIATFFCIVTFPVFCAIAAIAPWIFQANAFAKWLLLIPFVDILAVVLLFTLIERLCGGLLTCK
jgi:hypothetical protein